MESGAAAGTGGDDPGRNIKKDPKASASESAPADSPENMQCTADRPVGVDSTATVEEALAADLERVEGDLVFNSEDLRRAHSDDSMDSYGIRIPQAPPPGANKHARNIYISEKSLKKHLDKAGLKSAQESTGKRGTVPFKYYSPRATHKNAGAAQRDTALKRSDSDIRAEKAQKLIRKKEEAEDQRYEKELQRTF